MDLKAVLFGLKTLFRDVTNKHIRIKFDNTTAVASINYCGSIKHLLMAVTEAIFEWARTKYIELSAECFLGSLNDTAVLASHARDFTKTGGLCLLFFIDICGLYGDPTTGLFATRINTQLPLFLFLEI